MILPNDQLNNKEDGHNMVVEVQDVKLDVESEVGQGVKMLEVGDDESDFSDDCQMDFDVIKDLWVRKQKKPPWAEVASVRSKSSFSLLSFHYLSVLDQTIQGASSLKSTVLELIALPGIFGDLLHTLVSRFLKNAQQLVVFFFFKIASLSSFFSRLYCTCEG